MLTESDLKARLPDEKKAKKLRITVHSVGQGFHDIEDFGMLVKSKSNTVKLPNGQLGFKGCKLGNSSQEGSQPQQVILETAHIQTKLLTSIKVIMALHWMVLNSCTKIRLVSSLGRGEAR